MKDRTIDFDRQFNGFIIGTGIEKDDFLCDLPPPHDQ
jgi:hypothetical protein